VSTLEKAYRMVDIGPNSESKEEVYIHLHISSFSFCFHIWVAACITVLTHYLKQALEFQKFWGEKAELRRFKDGRIAESTGEAFIVSIHFLFYFFIFYEQHNFLILLA